jgi:hypothetical protein
MACGSGWAITTIITSAIITTITTTAATATKGGYS